MHLAPRVHVRLELLLQQRAHRRHVDQLRAHLLGPPVLRPHLGHHVAVPVARRQPGVARDAQGDAQTLFSDSSISRPRYGSGPASRTPTVPRKKRRTLIVSFVTLTGQARGEWSSEGRQVKKQRKRDTGLYAST